MKSFSFAGGRWVVWGFAVVVAMTAAACDSESTGPGDPGAVPPLPPLSSMAVDFSSFNSGGSSGLASAADLSGLVTGNSARAVGPNFTTASISLLLAEVVAVVVLAIPTAAFGAALQAQPSYDDGFWHWRTTTAAQGGTWSAHLSGTIQGADAIWEMRITSPSSATPSLEDFLWYGGVSELDGSSGVWRVYDPEGGGSNEALRIDWSHASAESHSLTITVTKPGAPDSGDYITYVVDGPLRTVSYFDASDGSMVEIGWNASTGEGYIIAPAYNGGTKSCWDTAQNNVICEA